MLLDSFTRPQATLNDAVDPTLTVAGSGKNLLSVFCLRNLIAVFITNEYVVVASNGADRYSDLHVSG